MYSKASLNSLIFTLDLDTVFSLWKWAKESMTKKILRTNFKRFERISCFQYYPNVRWYMWLYKQFKHKYPKTFYVYDEAEYISENDNTARHNTNAKKSDNHIIDWINKIKCTDLMYMRWLYGFYLYLWEIDFKVYKALKGL